MLSIDGIATGIDTTSIVEGLLSIQQSQIDRFNARKQGIVDEQAAFKGLEAKLLALQGSLAKLTRISDNAFKQKQISVSDETAVKAAVSDSAAEGVYRIRVESLARSHQIASNAYAGSDAEIALGSYDLQIGDGSVSTIAVDETNNTLEGLMQTINDSNLGVTASVIDDGSSGDSFHLLLVANEPGAGNNISVSFTPAADPGVGTELTFDFDNPVQAASDAAILLGSGDGALRVVNANNQFDDLFAGVTFEALRADPETEIELNVLRDVESAETAVNEFVDLYNDVVAYIQEQARFDPQTETATVLFGNRNVSTIRNDLSQAITTAVPGIQQAVNRLSAIGVDITADGKLTVANNRLSAVLNGQVEGVSLDDVLGLFSTQGKSDHRNIQFVLASGKTQASQVTVNANGESVLVPYGVRILKAAEKAHVSGAALADPITIDENNNKFSIVIDKGKQATVTLADGTYQPQEIADHLQQLLDNHQDLKNRPVTVAISDGALTITSASFGQSSEVTLHASSALASLGFTGTETDIGLDVVGHFFLQDSDGNILKDQDGNEIIERAVGRGQTLIGQAGKDGTGKDNPAGATEGLQVRVTLTPAQITEEITANITVTRGIAARLELAISRMTDPQGSLDRIENEFETRIESIDESINRLNRLFEARQQSLLAQFARLESSVSDLQSIGNLLGTQLSSLPQI